MMIGDESYLMWPFFDAAHAKLAREVAAWAAAEVGDENDAGDDVDAVCRRFVGQLGRDGWLRYVVPAAWGGLRERLDVRSLCLIREALAAALGLADFAFAMQGLGTGPVTLFGSDALRRAYLPPVLAGERIGAFALSEASAGSDVAAMQTAAKHQGDHWVINGAKTWISNAGIAHHYVVFCRMEGQTDRPFVAFMVDADNPGLEVTARIEAAAPHVLGSLALHECVVPASHMIGAPGDGMRIALGTLNVFRPTVGAAALGFARRALSEALAWVLSRRAFGRVLAEHQLTAARVADMALDIDASALLVYRAAWAQDQGEGRASREAAMAKLQATEAAQRVVDAAVQLLGGRGVVRGEVVERLYREVRALRITRAPAKSRSW